MLCCVPCVYYILSHCRSCCRPWTTVCTSLWRSLIVPIRMFGEFGQLKQWLTLQSVSWAEPSALWGHRFSCFFVRRRMPACLLCRIVRRLWTNIKAFWCTHTYIHVHVHACILGFAPFDCVSCIIGTVNMQHAYVGTITYLSKFGYFLFMTIGFSLFFALGLYPVLLMLLGPPFGRQRRSHLCCDIPAKDDPHL